MGNSNGRKNHGESSRRTIKVVVAAVGDATKLATGTEAITVGSHEPNLVVTVVAPLRAVAIRFANVFLVQFVGLLIAGMTPAGGKTSSTPEILPIYCWCVRASRFLAPDSIFSRISSRYSAGSSRNIRY